MSGPFYDPPRSPIGSASNENFTSATAAYELGRLVNKFDIANVSDTRRMWILHPRFFNYLNNFKNSYGIYVWREELSQGKLLCYPFKKSTQIPINVQDAAVDNKYCSFVTLVEVTGAFVLDSITVERAVSREIAYVDQIDDRDRIEVCCRKSDDPNPNALIETALIVIYAVVATACLLALAMFGILAPRIVSDAMHSISCPSAPEQSSLPQSPARVFSPGAGRAFSEIDPILTAPFWSQP